MEWDSEDRQMKGINDGEEEEEEALEGEAEEWGVSKGETPEDSGLKGSMKGWFRSEADIQMMLFFEGFGGGMRLSKGEKEGYGTSGISSNKISFERSRDTV